MATLKLDGKRSSMEGQISTRASAKGNATQYEDFAIVLMVERDEPTRDGRANDYHRLSLSRAEAQKIVNMLGAYLAATVS